MTIGPDQSNLRDGSPRAPHHHPRKSSATFATPKFHRTKRELTSGLQAHATPVDSISPTTVSLLGAVLSFLQTGIISTPCQITIATSQHITAILVHPIRLIRRIRFPREMRLFVLLVVYLMEGFAKRGVGSIFVVTEQLYEAQGFEL